MSSKLKKILTALVLGVSLSVGSAQAITVQPGASYTGQVKLEFPLAGASFTLPSGWKGGIPNGKGVFVLGNTSLAGIGVVGIQSRAAADVLKEMRQPIQFIGNTQLILTGSVQRKNNRLFGLYRVQGAKQAMVAYVVSVFGSTGKVMTFAIAAKQSNVQKLASDVEIMMASVVISAPTIPPKTIATQGNSPLAQLLSGLKLTYMKTGSVTRTRIDLYLCKSGKFYRINNSGGFSPGAVSTLSMASRNKGQGQWSMIGTQGFILRYNNGAVANIRVTFQGTKLFLNGTRYFKNGSAGC